MVIEASAVTDALVGDPVNPDLLQVIAEQDLHAPALLDFEVASALRGHALGGLLDPDRLGEAVADFAELQIQRHHMTTLLGRILQLRDNLSVYDAAYVVLAQALEATLVTADGKLQETRRLGVDVRILRPAL